MNKVNVLNQTIGNFLLRSKGLKPTPEQLDDELETVTGCRFGEKDNCKSPDCKHNQSV